MSGELVVGVSGSPSDPSRTSTLVAATVARLGQEIEGARTETVEIGPLLADLGSAPSREAMSDRTRFALETVEAADVLVVGSPAFRAAYSGAFKLLLRLDRAVRPRRHPGAPDRDGRQRSARPARRAPDAPAVRLLPVHHAADRCLRERAGLRQARGWLRHRERRPRAPHRPGRAPGAPDHPRGLRHRRRARGPTPGRVLSRRTSHHGAESRGRGRIARRGPNRADGAESRGRRRIARRGSVPSTRDARFRFPVNARWEGTGTWT
ncbi:NAD(P)H-dependent oxidoreductase [Curtobacterium flaccumfaciens]|nr:NAD(P)H-dependent oxidoreductase [Curtobacterium flaccumfaciens]